MLSFLHEMFSCESCVRRLCTKNQKNKQQQEETDRPHISTRTSSLSEFPNNRHEIHMQTLERGEMSESQNTTLYPPIGSQVSRTPTPPTPPSPASKKRQKLQEEDVTIQKQQANISKYDIPSDFVIL